MRRTLLSCTSLARNGLIGACHNGIAAAPEPAWAGDLPLAQAISAWLDLNHQEFAVLTTALALLGFSVVAAILLMRTRVRATQTEVAAALRDRRSAGPGRPAARAAVRRTAGPDLMGRRRQSAADQRRHLAVAVAGRPAEFAAAHSRLRNLAAAGTGAADGPCRRRAARGRRRLSAQPLHLERPRDRGDGPRHRRPGHCPDSRTRRLAAGTRRIEPALQDAAGRDRAVARLRRRRALADLGQERSKATCAMPTPPMCGPPRAASVADAIHRNLELLESDQRTEMDRALNDNSSLSRAAADRGRRRAAHL